MQADSGFPRYLKSNMDRFIAISVIYTLISIVNLKSNMDRFIGHFTALIIRSFTI